MAAAVEWCPSAIVLDVRMPHKDGLTTLTELKASEATRDIPVIMLSASIIDEQAALHAGLTIFSRSPTKAGTCCGAGHRDAQLNELAAAKGGWPPEHETTKAAKSASAMTKQKVLIAEDDLEFGEVTYEWRVSNWGWR